MYGYMTIIGNDYRIMAMIAMTAIHSDDDSCYGDHAMPMMMIMKKYRQRRRSL
jgi:hypothetical protein